MIMLLNQQRKFEALDFCYHILRIQRVDGKDEVVNGIVSELLRQHALSTDTEPTNRHYSTETQAHGGSHTTLPGAEQPDFRRAEQVSEEQRRQQRRWQR